MNLGRTCVFLSGTGSNFQAVGDLGEIVDLRLVISDRPRARGLSRARLLGIPTLCLEKPVRWDVVLGELEARRIRSILLLGFMRIIPATFLNAWTPRLILNLHPSLLPLYPGLHAIESAWKDRSPIGATIHDVIPAVDAGQIRMQKKTCRFGDSSVAETEFATHRLEHRMVRKLAEKGVRHGK